MSTLNEESNVEESTIAESTSTAKELTIEVTWVLKLKGPMKGEYDSPIFGPKNHRWHVNLDVEDQDVGCFLCPEFYSLGEASRNVRYTLKVTTASGLENSTSQKDPVFYPDEACTGYGEGSLLRLSQIQNSDTLTIVARISERDSDGAPMEEGIRGNLKGLLLSDQLCDLQLHIFSDRPSEDVKPSSGAILSGHSNYFATMFGNGMLEAGSGGAANMPVVRIVGYDDETIKTMLEHIYTGTLKDHRPSTLDERLAILRLADQYNLLKLFEVIARDIIRHNLKHDTAVQILYLAYQYETFCPKFRDACLRYVKENLKNLRQGPDFKESWIKYGDLHMMYDTFSHILDHQKNADMSSDEDADRW